MFLSVRIFLLPLQKYEERRLKNCVYGNTGVRSRDTAGAGGERV